MRLMSVSTLAGAIVAGTMLGTAATAGAQEVLKLHHLLPPVSAAQKLMLEPWAKKVETESGGKIKIEIYPSMQLGGTPPQLIDQVRDGTVDIVWTLPGYTPGRFIQTEVFELPFMHSSTVVSNKAYTEFAANHPEVFQDFKVIALHVHAGQLFHSHDPIKTADSFKGMKIRTPTRTSSWMIEAMGAVPIGAPVPKIPEMLSKRVVDAVIIPYEVTLPLKVHEMVKYHTILDDPKFPRINTSTFIIAMNKQRYEKLSPELKKVIDNNSGMVNAEWIGKAWDAAEKPGRDKSLETGEEAKLPAAEVAKLRKMVEQPVIDRWIADVASKGIDGKALVAEARALIEKHAK